MPAFTRRVPASRRPSTASTSTSTPTMPTFTPPATTASASTSTSHHPSATSASVSTTASSSPSASPSPSASRSASKNTLSGSKSALPTGLPTGLPSLDDLLSPSGLPRGSVLLVLAPDGGTAWSRLVWRYFIARGLADGDTCVVAAEAEAGRDAVAGCMWLEEGYAPALPEESSLSGVVGTRGAGAGGSESEGEGAGVEAGLEDAANGRLGARRIAWRYDHMETFKTSVGGLRCRGQRTVIHPPSSIFHLPSSTFHLPSSGQYQPASLLSSRNQYASSPQLIHPGSKGKGRDLSLLRTIPPDLVRTFEDDSTVTYLDSSCLSTREILARVYRQVRADRTVRVGVAELGGWGWGNGQMSSTDVLRFLHSLRGILRDTRAGAIVTLPSSVPASWGGSREAWIAALSWSVDSCIELQGFGDDPTLPLAFPHSHGLFTLHSYPTTSAHSLLPPTLKHSTLLGAGAGENNLGFKLKRKRFVIETVHLGVEGGVGERRTAPAEDVGRMVGKLDSRPPLSGETGVAATSTTPVASVTPVTSGTHGVGEGEAGTMGNMGVVAAAQGVGMPRGPREETRRKPRAKVRFGGEEELGPAPEVEVGVGVEAGVTGKHVHHGPSPSHQHEPNGRDGGSHRKVGIRHDRPDLYDF